MYFKIKHGPTEVVVPFSPEWSSTDGVRRVALEPAASVSIPIEGGPVECKPGDRVVIENGTARVVSASSASRVNKTMAMEFSEEDMTGLIRVWLRKVDLFVDSAGAVWRLGPDGDEYHRTAPGEAPELWSVRGVAEAFAAREEIHAAYRVRAMAEAAFVRASERFAKDPTMYNGRVSKRAREMSDDANERLADYGVEGWA